MITNLERQILTKTNDLDLCYALARVHSMAFARAAEIESQKKDGMPFFGYSYARRLPPLRPGKAAETNAASAVHLERSIALYREALRLSPKDLRSQLGLAWDLDQKGDRQAALGEYRKALSLAWTSESSESFLLEGSTVTEEVVGYMLPLLDSEKDKEEIQRLKKYQSWMKAKGRAWTPILVPLTEDVIELQELVDPCASVSFDLDGSGVLRCWSWITPNAGWLVYDHDGKGTISSGLQLFGGATFWVFWRNGYQALAALDDDGNGRLEGSELHGLAIWRDADCDGIADPGEVVPVGNLGIVGIGVTYGLDQGGVPFSKEGVVFENGTTRPTYDWTASSHSESIQ